MIHIIYNHHITKKILKLFSLAGQSILFIVLLFTVFTFVSSRMAVLGSIRSLVVLTGSMEPKLPVGSVIFIKKQIAYNKGDIITFASTGGQNVTHRIIDFAFTAVGTVYTTQGDANNTADSHKVSLDKVSGKVFFAIPFVGKVIAFLNKPLGFFIFVVFPTLIFVGYELWNIKKEIEIQTEKRILEKLQQTEQMQTVL